VEVATRVRRNYSQTVVCPGCGRLRELTDRHVRRGGSETTLCNLCRFPARKLPPTNVERRWWLELYTDEEIGIMAEAMFGGNCDHANIYAWRLRLKVDEPKR
jgi:hypothetical protein